MRKEIMNCIVPCRRQISMLDLQARDPTSNKENLPLALDPQRRRSSPQLNQVPSTTRRGMWTDETLKIAMDTFERKTHSLRKANGSWNIPMSSFFDHLSGKTRSIKMGPGGVLIKEEDSIVIAWILVM